VRETPKRVAALALVALAGGCTIALRDDPPATAPDAPRSFSSAPSPDGRCEHDGGSGDLDRSENACLEQLRDFAERNGDDLRLRFRDGSTRTYRNLPEDCERGSSEHCVKYELAGYFPRHALLLLRASHREGGEWLLVSDRDGRETKIVAPPRYSPGGQWLASASAGRGPAGGGNGIDIVPTSSDPAMRGFRYRVPDGDGAAYEFLTWDGDDRLRLNVTFAAAGETKTAPAEVVRVNGAWQLNGGPPRP
jgi:hypothetical protein